VVGFLPAGGISWRQLSAILRYIPEDHVRAMATQLSAAGVLNVNDDGIGFSDEGRRSAQAVINVLPAPLHELWNVDVDRLDALLSLAQPIAAVATADAMTSPKIVDAILRPTASTTSFELWHALARSVDIALTPTPPPGRTRRTRPIRSSVSAQDLNATRSNSTPTSSTRRSGQQSTPPTEHDSLQASPASTASATQPRHEPHRRNHSDQTSVAV